MNQKNLAASPSKRCISSTVAMASLIIASINIGLGELSLVKAQGKSGKPVCMTSDRKSEDPLLIVLPQGNRSALQAKRFKVIRCSDAFANEKEFEAWRDSVCDLASLPLEDIQKQFAAAYGVRAQVLCGLAEAVSGQWNRGKKRRP
ncbi:hypothetical protein [Erythrobacter sp. YT30]|uniref:hypothetical protein n=1 Tax=Erythrobacter sp. YT30 TaxID=1735012 RepID=UPI00076CF302|nr:hypothetical protein [Erythrobacter sp. YT30]KWV91777.1 hypothetical protein AUC45_11275 [Erythrobacter sp. YT30]